MLATTDILAAVETPTTADHKQLPQFGGLNFRLSSNLN
jgi:hypothetical protein